MGKNVGIITFHRAVNYGAALQAYGLWAALQDLGANAQIIDYRNEHIETSYKLSWGRKKTYEGLKEWAPTVPARQSKTNKFRRFLSSEAVLTRECARDTVSAATEGLDAVITGSDQVFNPNLFGRDPAYFLDFAKVPTKRYSYAASMGSFTFNAGKDAEFIQLLDRFEQISVRESSAVPAIQAVTDVPVRVDVDPTLLVGRDGWNALLPEERIREKPYIFCYSVHPFKSGLDKARELARKTGHEVVFLHNRILNADAADKGGAILLHDSSPYDWLRLIRDADCVITNSFHGTVFSTIFNKPFMSEIDTRGGFNNRILRLLCDTGLADRIVERCNLESHPIGDIAFADIDWEKANAFVSGRREESLGYLAGICS